LPKFKLPRKECIDELRILYSAAFVNFLFGVKEPIWLKHITWFQLHRGAGMSKRVVPVGQVPTLIPNNRLLTWGGKSAATKGQNSSFMGKMVLFNRRTATAMIPEIFPVKEGKNG
jgi:hypothetical protein